MMMMSLQVSHNHLLSIYTQERLLANNAQTYWVPSFVKDHRFHNWLADAKVSK